MIRVGKCGTHLELKERKKYACYMWQRSICGFEILLRWILIIIIDHHPSSPSLSFNNIIIAVKNYTNPIYYNNLT